MWWVYILKCKGGSLYTGSTNNLTRRFAAHRAGKGGKYTRAFPPIRIVYREQLKTKSAALKREIAIKQLSRRAKLALFH